MKLMLQDVRIAFPQLWTAKQVNGEGKPAFSASFLMPPEHPACKLIEDAMFKVAVEKWGAKGKATHDALVKAGKVCFRDGDAKSEYEGYPGNMFISARSPTRPTVFDKNPSIQLLEADGKPYAGCFVNASIEIWAQDNGYGKRINAQLRGVQFRRGGDAFAGGQPAAENEFSDISTEEEASPFD